MSTTHVPRGGGVDRTGLDNLLGSSDHPMNGLAYSKSLLGGHLIGVLPLTDGRYACFFKEYSYVESGEVKQSENKVLLLSTVSGSSLPVVIGVEDQNWISFDSSGRRGYLLVEKEGVASLVVLQSDVDKVNLLSVNEIPTATNEKGEPVVFDSGVSVGGGFISVASTSHGGVYLARTTQSGVTDKSSWEFLSENTYRKSKDGLRSQKGTKGTLEAEGVIHFVEIQGAGFIFVREESTVTLYKKNRYGVWSKSDSIESPESEGVLGFCLMKSIPAYSEEGYRYTIPAVFSVAGEPIAQHWVMASIN